MGGIGAWLGRLFSGGGNTAPSSPRADAPAAPSFLLYPANYEPGYRPPFLPPAKRDLLIKRLLGGRAPTGLKVGQSVDLSPARMRSLPPGFQVNGDLILRGCTRLQRIGPGLCVTGSLVLGPGAGKTGDPQCYIKELPVLEATKLVLSRCVALERLPEGLDVEKLELTACHALRELPPGLRLKSLTIKGCRNLRHLPPDLVVEHLTLINAAIEEVPAIAKLSRLKIENCLRLHSLPDKLECQYVHLCHLPRLRTLPAFTSKETRRIELNSLSGIEDLCRAVCADDVNVTGCVNLKRFDPVTLKVSSLVLSNCPKLERLPARLTAQRLAVRNCEVLNHLPSPLVLSLDSRSGACLDMSGCGSLIMAPEVYDLQGSVCVTHAGWASHPPPVLNFAVRHRSVTLPARDFYSNDPDAALGQANAEVRRVMLERIGLEKVLAGAKSKVLDEDRDAGGLQQLLHIAARNGSDPQIVYLRCQCPSTARVYLLRVPPVMRTCRAAAAWLAGFDDPEDYQPLLET